MPPLIFHQPVSAKETVLSGCQLWPQSMVKQHMEAVVWQCRNPDWSNENQGKELLPEVYLTSRAIDAERKDPDVWGPEGDRIAFFKLAMVRFILRYGSNHVRRVEHSQIKVQSVLQTAAGRHPVLRILLQHFG